MEPGFLSSRFPHWLQLTPPFGTKLHSPWPSQRPKTLAPEEEPQRNPGPEPVSCWNGVPRRSPGAPAVPGRALCCLERPWRKVGPWHVLPSMLREPTLGGSCPTWGRGCGEGQGLGQAAQGFSSDPVFWPAFPFCTPGTWSECISSLDLHPSLTFSLPRAAH